MREIDRSGPTPPAVSRRATPAELEATYRIVAPIARTLGRSLGLDETALDEVVQRVGLVLVEKRASYDPARGTLRSWGFGVACNVVHHVWTAANVEEQRAAHVPVSRLPSPLPTPEQSLRAREALRIVRDCLSPEHAAVFELSALGCTAEEISAALRLPITTVEWRLRRGRGRSRPFQRPA
ncbi:MAG: sigma-70 family RNA polymerase sigma factor [Polyangiaceae bacterium]